MEMQRPPAVSREVELREVKCFPEKELLFLRVYARSRNIYADITCLQDRADRCSFGDLEMRL